MEFLFNPDCKLFYVKYEIIYIHQQLCTLQTILCFCFHLFTFYIYIYILKHNCCLRYLTFNLSKVLLNFFYLSNYVFNSISYNTPKISSKYFLQLKF